MNSPSFRGARSANPESSNAILHVWIPGLRASHASRNDGYNASSTAFAMSLVPWLPPNSIGLIPSA
jgi:hypothetical protein